MGWFSDDKPKPGKDGDKPWNKPLSDDAADKLLKALKKKDPKDKNNPGDKPEKRGGWR
jgi:hypothetical protein